jgi:hypothetical protein
MTRLHQMRRFARWLVGLFIFAQIAGVVPLISSHTLHVFESKQVITGEDGIEAVGSHGTHHHHSIADLNDQCCAFHHLAGVLAYGVTLDPVRFAEVVIGSFVPSALVAADPMLLERPPKSLSLI